jgi:hypothetical protein
MKPRFKLYRRKLGGTFYVQDNQTNKQESLNTRNRDEAVTLLHARNEAARQPQLNLQIAKAYSWTFRVRGAFAEDIPQPSTVIDSRWAAGHFGNCNYGK